eukprot:gnl/MRDRNA2_/MRDRNA2_51228_c0_seq1.p1 gnl/MRDRNA2_/MRDRNA2_51228_c0~~gnl/MRDRNA2_/MRDRNA2_51228_c0_seq1.p1  ORF type:complete len:333 (-),score=23.55 gnl/MRDRNA2_/MRDRNA2_51228_c0_seq1:188-1081(-)
MGAPLFLPVDPKYFLWPRSHFIRGQNLEGKSCGLYVSWVGKHQIAFELEGGAYLFANYSIKCSGSVQVQTVFREGSSQGRLVSEAAQLTPLETMDENGNTHALMPASNEHGLLSHEGRCVRFTRYPVSDRLTIWLGPRVGVCAALDRSRKCASGVVNCARMRWSFGGYQANPPPALAAAARARYEPVEFDHSTFGATYWYLGSTVLGRRRRGGMPGVSPFDLASHGTLHRWVKDMDFVAWPGVHRFVSAAGLVQQLLGLQALTVSQEMRTFHGNLTLNVLAAWHAIVLILLLPEGAT